jgi:[acyl-carrier-protein] S-malonyltransferase
VISGHKTAVERAMLLAKERGAKRAVLLPVSSAFHSPLMSAAAEVMERALEQVTLIPPRRDIIHNVTAKTAHTPDAIKQHLIDQICGQVLWQKSLKEAGALGATGQLEIGHGKVLTGLAKRVMPDWQCVILSTPHDIEQFVTNRQAA